MKTFQEIRTENKSGYYYAIGINGEKYEATYVPEFRTMFFTVPASVEIVGYIKRYRKRKAAK